MNREEAHQLIDKLYDAQPIEGVLEIDTAEPAPERVLPEGLRAVRTKTSGDRVYLLDEEKKTRQWITNPEVLQSYGFEAIDVQDVEDSEMLKYNMAPALYKPKE